SSWRLMAMISPGLPSPSLVFTIPFGRLSRIVIALSPSLFLTASTKSSPGFPDICAAAGEAANALAPIRTKTPCFTILGPNLLYDALAWSHLAEQGSPRNERYRAILGTAARHAGSRRVGGSVRPLRPML